MPGLTIIVASKEHERFRAAIELAAANAALGERSRIFLQGEAAALLASSAMPEGDPAGLPGMPTLAQLIEEAHALGTEFVACQSGLAAAGISAQRLPQHVATGGLIQILSTRDDDQLVMA